MTQAANERENESKQQEALKGPRPEGKRRGKKGKLKDSKEAKAEVKEEETKAGPEETNAEEDSHRGEEAEEKKDELPREDYKSKYFYLAAEMENMKRRFERERENFLKYGSEKILSALIEVVDNFDRSIEALGSDEDKKVVNIRVGMEMVRTQFLEVLKAHGLETVQALGEEFDPNFHEAIGQQAVEGKKEQEVIQEYQKGYLLNGRLLRAAKVIVAKGD